MQRRTPGRALTRRTGAPRHVRPGMVLVASVVVSVSLVMSGCGLVGPDRRPDEQTSSTQSPSASPSGGPGSPVPGTPVRGPDQQEWPFAGFDPAEHELFDQAPDSPDRLTEVESAATPQGFVGPPAGEGIQRYTDQQIAWQACQGGECARVVVPLDWDEPDGQAITLAVFRKRATGTHRGSLFVNPGGPGASGLAMARGFDGTPFPGRDIVGWDPRGSGESTPVRCGTTQQTDALNALDQSPDAEAEWQALVAGQQEYARQCRQASGRLLDHISTLDTVRDLDYLRHLVSDPKLTYLGISYGTWIGALYAELYPARTGALVLDSAVNITEDESVIQAMGFDLALGEFADWCVQRGDCQLGSSREQVLATITGYFAARDRTPLQVDGRRFHDTSAVMGVAAHLYSGKPAYESLYNSLMWAVSRNDPQYLQRAGDWLLGRDDHGYGSLAHSFPAIACADSPDDGLEGARVGWPRDADKAPVFGRWMGPGLACAYWTAEPMPPIKVTAEGSSPILVLGATGDPATPYQQSVWMAEQLEQGVLVGWRGAGHSAYSLGNTCVRSIVHDFVNRGTVPRDGTMC